MMLFFYTFVASRWHKVAQPKSPLLTSGACYSDAGLLRIARCNFTIKAQKVLDFHLQKLGEQANLMVGLSLIA